MARMKKPDNETEQQAAERRVLEAIANHATRSEKTAWSRKRKNMETLVGKLTPLENKMIELRSKMTPIYDEVAVLRAEMVDECIHPYDLLVNKGEYTECKFCNKKLVVRPPVADVSLVENFQIDSSTLPVAEWATKSN